MVFEVEEAGSSGWIQPFFLQNLVANVFIVTLHTH
jgi:hypothetical protein